MKNWDNTADILRKEMGLRKKVKVYMSGQVDSPLALVGLLAACSLFAEGHFAPKGNPAGAST